MLGRSRLFFIVRSDHLFVLGQVAGNGYRVAHERCGTGIALSIANLVLSDDVSPAFNVNHSAHIRWFVSACHRRGKPLDSQKTIRS